MGGVDRQAKRGVTVRDGAADAILDEGVVAAHIELKHAQGVRRRLGGLLQPGFGHRAQHMGGAERPAARATLAPAPGSNNSSAPTGASTTGKRSLRPNTSTERVDLGDIAQHARTESDLVQRHAVAAHRGLGLGGADDVVPGILVEVGARLADELVKVLELLAARAEFDGRWRDAGCLVHGVLPGSWAAQPLPFRYRVRCFSTRHGASGLGGHYLGLPLGRCGRARISSSEPARLPPRPGPKPNEETGHVRNVAVFAAGDPKH